MRLFPKLLLSFIAVILAGVITVSLVANQAATREMRAFMVNGGMTTESGLAQELAGYYRGHGSWEGVAAVLADVHMRGMMMDQQILLADAGGQIVVDTANQRLSQTLTENEIANGTAISLDNQRVGTLIAQGGMMMNSLRLDSLEDGLALRVNRAIWLAAGAAGGVALIVGSFLAYNLARPIQQLTEATTAVARGDFTRRVPAAAKDEIGQLAASFNSMADHLQQAEQLRRDMTADIAHELRNPLAVLQSNLEAFTDGVLAPTVENLQPLLDQTQLLSRLVDDLRTLALAESGQLQLERRPVDPASLARSVIARFMPLAEAKHIGLSAEIDVALPVLNIDAQRIEQVLGNLLSNAIRHTPEGGRVICRLMDHDPKAPQPQPGVTFTVSDTGPGIPPGALSHIFERFYRVERSRSRSEGGSGLGLAIARQLVELHGGQISASSQLNQGTDVTFTLPLTNVAA